MRTGGKSPERSGYELLGMGNSWSKRLMILATFARYGLITPVGPMFALAV